MNKVVTLPIREQKLADDPRRSYTLPARLYTSAETLNDEAEAIFFRSWMYAGHVEDLAAVGSYVTRRILDQNIMIIRGKDHKLRAFYNVCSHRAHELVKGAGQTKVIVCPYHAWSYHLDGRLRTARGSEKVDGFNGDEFCLKAVQVEEFGPLVFVNLDPGAPSLASQAGDMLAEMRSKIADFDRLTRVETRSWEIKANWKVIVDNFLECYHCKNAHPAFAQLVDLDTYRSVTHGIYSTHLSKSGRPDNKAYGFSKDDASQIGAFWWLWPTFTLNVAPGPANMAVFYVLPLGPDRSLEVTEYFFLSKSVDADQAARLDYANNVLTIEDNDICEAVQRGLGSRGYSQGRFIVDRERTEISEHAVHHFHTLVAQALGL
jgi:phenylpropionate dioxygenase-like ring-hydroxylating dioxygenase large terminal subunit